MEKTKTPAFDAQSFLDATGVARGIVGYRRKAAVFTQGNASRRVMHIQKGGVKLSVVNEVGKEAVVAMLEPGGRRLARTLLLLAYSSERRESATWQTFLGAALRSALNQSIQLGG